MTESPEGLQFFLNFVLGSEVDDGALAIPVPADILVEKDSIGLDELAANAIHRIPGDFKEYHQRVAAALDALEQRPNSTLEVHGPTEGDYYIVLPEENPGTE